MFLVVYLRLYTDCLLKAVKGISRNAWTLLLPVLLMMTLFALIPLVARLGVVGGIALSLLFDAMFSCYLYFTGEVVANSKVTVGELKKSVGSYFWSVMNLLFVIWIARFVLDAVLGANPNRWMIDLALGLLALVLLNPVPEVMYVRGTRGGVDTIRESIGFIQENWIEWFVPNLLIGALWSVFLLATTGGQMDLPSLLLNGPMVMYALGQALLGPVGGILSIAVFGALFHLVMVFRGHLFEALHRSSHRQRMFKYRNAES